MDKYIILRAKSVQKLAEIVNTAIEAGYTVQGHPFQDWFAIYQAMTLTEQVKEKEPVSIPFKSKSKN